MMIGAVANLDSLKFTFTKQVVLDQPDPAEVGVYLLVKILLDTDGA
jgi:hypothetical protein